MNWLLALIAALGIGVVSAPAAPATPALPSQCPGTIASYNVIDRSGQNAVVQGTAGADFIIVKTGVVNGGEGNDCILFTDTQFNGLAYGDGGNDVIIGKGSFTSGQAYGDYTQQYPITYYVPEGCDPDVDSPCGQITYSPPTLGNADRCIGKWASRRDCELN